MVALGQRGVDFCWSNGPRTLCVVLMELSRPRGVSVTSIYILETGLAFQFIFFMDQDQRPNEGFTRVPASAFVRTPRLSCLPGILVVSRTNTVERCQ